MGQNQKVCAHPTHTNSPSRLERGKALTCDGTNQPSSVRLRHLVPCAMNHRSSHPHTFNGEEGTESRTGVIRMQQTTDATVQGVMHVGVVTVSDGKHSQKERRDKRSAGGIGDQGCSRNKPYPTVVMVTKASHMAFHTYKSFSFWNSLLATTHLQSSQRHTKYRIQSALTYAHAHAI